MIKKALLHAWRWLKRAFTKNMGMKIGALAFAFLLWSFVLAESNPPRTKVFADIPVSYKAGETTSATEYLKQKELAVATPMSETLKTVTVTVQTEADKLSLITEDMITAVVDVSNITSEGEYTLPVKAKSMVGMVVDVNPSEVTLNVEEMVTKDVPVEVQLQGEKEDWLYYGEPILSATTVQVIGARSNVDRVTKAVCYIDITGLEMSSKETRALTPVNGSGETLPVNMFSGTLSAIVELPIYPQQDAMVNKAIILEMATGVAEGYEITGVVVTPTKVAVAGKLEDIEQITTVNLEPIALENATTDQVVNVRIAPPEGAVAVVPAEVQVQITIQAKEEIRNYPAVDIGTKNLEDGLSATLQPSSVDIEVRGTKAVLGEFTADKLKPMVDLEGLGKGVHTVTIKFENEPDLGVKITPAVASVTVTIK